MAEALGLGDEAANGRGHEEPVSNPLSKSISAPVPSRDHGGVVAGISPQPKDVPGENTVDHHKAFAAVNTAMSGPEALMQRKFGALGNIADLPETLPPAKGGLFDAVAGPRGDSAELRQRVTKFVSSLTSSTADTRVSTKLADFITDHPTTDGDLVNAIIQPVKPPAKFVEPPGWGFKPDVQLPRTRAPTSTPSPRRMRGKPVLQRTPTPGQILTRRPRTRSKRLTPRTSNERMTPKLRPTPSTLR